MKRLKHKAIEDYVDYINELLKEASYFAVGIKEFLGEITTLKGLIEVIQSLKQYYLII